MSNLKLLGIMATKEKYFSKIVARNYSRTFGYFTTYVKLPNWLFEKYTDDDQLRKACIDYVNNITCNPIHVSEEFELCIK